MGKSSKSSNPSPRKTAKTKFMHKQNSPSKKSSHSSNEEPSLPETLKMHSKNQQLLGPFIEDSYSEMSDSFSEADL